MLKHVKDYEIFKSLENWKTDMKRSLGTKIRDINTT